MGGGKDSPASRGGVRARFRISVGGREGSELDGIAVGFDGLGQAPEGNVVIIQRSIIAGMNADLLNFAYLAARVHVLRNNQG